MSTTRARRPVPHPDPPQRPGAATTVLVVAIAVFIGVFVSLALARHAAFWTGRFDLGNMVQAVWATAHGDPLRVTNTAGQQFVRLGAHVDPILALFAPLWWAWPDPRMLLVAQVVIVAAGAVPVYALGRRWLGDDRLAVTCALVYLGYPTVQWSVLTEFHPVTLATPLLLGCIWAVDGARWRWLAVLAPLAALTKEQVGVALAMLGVWAVVRRGHRRAGALLIVGGLAWSAFCVAVVIPHFSPTGASPFVGRYAELGESQGDVVRTLLTRPWEAVGIAASMGRLGYLLALLLPLLLLPLLAPFVALGAVPDLVLNLLAQYWPQYSVQYQYTAVITAFLIAGMVGGLARLRTMRLPGPLRTVVARNDLLVVALLGAVVVGGYRLGPLPFWADVPGGSVIRAHEYRVGPHVAAQAAAVRLVPTDPEVAVSATNLLGSRLSARRRIYTWPVIKDAAWVVVDERRPYLGDRISTYEHRMLVAGLRRDPRFALRMSSDGVLVFQRIGPAS